MTGVNQTAGQLQEELADELGCDLVEVSAHAGARPEHAVWQGKIFSRSGKDPKYPPFHQSSGYGTGAGLCGWNCRHTFGPYIEGSPPVWTEEQLAELNAPKYDYNGKKLTEYEASQQQRYNERQIRRWKREEAAMQAAGLDSSEAAGKVKEWQARQRDFIEQTGSKRQYGREQISVANFGNRGILITGARIVDEESNAAKDHAKRYYGLVRSMSTDVDRISENTGFSKALVIEIKSFVFLEKHDLGGEEPEYFAPDFAMAESWQRLVSGQFVEHDLILLKHEEYERELMQRGMSQNDAHILATRKYNYGEESRKYYGSLRKDKKK